MTVYNLPSQPTSFVGREKELSQIAALLADPNCRLLTLVGPGGIGKTRLALQMAANLHAHFADRVYFVPLAPVTSANLLASAIEGAFEIPFAQLTQYLRERQALLVLDNFEHLLEGADLLTELLQGAPDIKILVTSREHLNLREEWLFILDGLSYPKVPTKDPLDSFESVQLFIQRARQIRSRFSLADNYEAVQSICQHVEGMPLGIELAATWLRTMSCGQIANQITQSLDFLTTPLRNVPERHRSLRRVFEQSWNLLSEHEQAVFMRLSVFRGGFDLEAAEQIADASLPVLASLVDKSLVRFNPDTSRYDLHELLRQYATEKLVFVNENSTIAQFHFDYFMTLAKQAEQHLFGRQQIAWFDRLQNELDNFRTALAWSTKSELGLQLAAALGWFFSERAHWNEGLNWLEQMLAAHPDAPASLRAKAFHRAGGIAGQMHDEVHLVAHCQSAIEIGEVIDDKWAIAWAITHLGTFLSDDVVESGKRLQNSLVLFREINDSMGIAHCSVRLAWNWLSQKEVNKAYPCVAEAFALSEEVGDCIMLAWSANALGKIAEFNQQFEEASRYFKASVEYFSQARTLDGAFLSYISLASAQIKLADLNKARMTYKEAFLSWRDNLRYHALSGWARTTILAGIAHIEVKQGQAEWAVALLAAADDEGLIRESRSDLDDQPYLPDIQIARDLLGEAAFTKAWAIGKTLTQIQIENCILNEQSPMPSKALDETLTKPNELLSEAALNNTITGRELEILKLLSDGLNSREIAQQLYLSVGTIRWYLKIIYSKLDAHSRSEAIAHAKEFQLLG